jgi:hypothetical protein
MTCWMAREHLHIVSTELRGDGCIIYQAIHVQKDDIDNTNRLYRVGKIDYFLLHYPHQSHPTQKLSQISKASRRRIIFLKNPNYYGSLKTI